MARDLFPHGRRRQGVRYLEPGGRVRSSGPTRPLYADSLTIKPRDERSSGPPTGTRSRSWWRRPSARGARACSVDGLPHLYRTWDRRAPGVYAPHTRFGDHIQTDLCASNLGAQAWARALTRGPHHVAASAAHPSRRPSSSSRSSTASHHERYFLPLGALRTRFLLGLCFCVLVRGGRARGAGVDGAACSREWARTESERALDGGDARAAGRLRSGDPALLGGELGALLARARGRRDARAGSSPRRRRRAPDSSCSTSPVRSRATRRAGPWAGPAPAIAWRVGIDVAACARAGAAIARSPTRPTRPASRSISGRTARSPATPRWSAAHAAEPPDCDSPRTSPRSWAARRGGRRPRRHLPLRDGAAGRARPRARGARAGRVRPRRTLRRSARPGVAPVCTPPSSTSSPFTATYWNPSASRRGSS